MSPPPSDRVATSAVEWAGRFHSQAAACDELGSPLYGRLMRLLAEDCRAEGSTWSVLRPHAALRFGQAGPLRLVGAAHRLALVGRAPSWAACLPSCGGVVPDDDAELGDAWAALVAEHPVELDAGLAREVQTNEVGRAAALAYGALLAGLPDGVRLVELGCSGGLNLRHDRYEVRLGSLRLGPPDSPVRLRPEVRGFADPGVDPDVGDDARSAGVPSQGAVVERIGLDPHPVDVTDSEGLATLLSFVWPDQPERIARVRAAASVAAEVPADLRAVVDTADALSEVLAAPAAPTLVQHSIVWQYIPVDQRWRITETLEEAGRRATAAAPLAWLRYEPDEWGRTRAALWLRRWPGGGDRLLAHADFHGRWISPVPA